MNYDYACSILEFTDCDDINEGTIKKQYRMLALVYHPDKNISDDASEKFIKIKEAYDYLLKYEGYMKSETESENNYSNILFYFLNSIIDESQNNIVYTILNKLSLLCEEKALTYLTNLDKTLLFTIYKIISKYKKAFHMNNTFLEQIKQILEMKTENDERVILNPTIHDLVEDKLYKLTYNESVYYVPLWHDELMYDNCGNDLYVICKPICPDNLDIDEYNNVHMIVSYTMEHIWNTDVLHIDIFNLEIQTRNLQIRKKQTICFKKRGISKINEKDVYDVSKKSNVYVTINIDY
tara:strand:- start:25244 stop:26125 length:882 start_codon:yes stop_codon:yes gene_type:complete